MIPGPPPRPAPQPARAPVPVQGGVANVLAYWHGLRCGRDVPARGDIDPAAIQRHLSQCAVVERTPTGHPRLRIAGRHWHALLGMEPRGLAVKALFHADARDRLSGLLASVFAGPHLLMLDVTAGTDRDGPLAGQVAAMPLLDDQGAISRALLVIEIDGQPETPPCRFRIRNAHLTPITAEGRARLGRPAGVQVSRPNSPPSLRVIRGGRG